MRHPSLLMDVFEMTHDDGHPEDPPPPGINKPNWCSCTRCREMPNDAERKCCGKTREGCLSIQPVSFTITHIHNRKSLLYSLFDHVAPLSCSSMCPLKLIF